MTTVFAVIGLLCTAAFVGGLIGVVVARTVHSWRTASWVFDRPALDPVWGKVEIEVRIPSLVPLWIAQRLAPRVYRRRCLDERCYPIEDPS